MTMPDVIAQAKRPSAGNTHTRYASTGAKPSV
jgi:hypothetical protein